MKKIIAGCIALIMWSAGVGMAQQDSGIAKRYIPVNTFDPKRDAAKDLQDAIPEARASGRRIILDVGGDWCIWCKRLDSLCRDDKEIRAFLDKNYVVVKINFSKENENEKFLATYPKIEGYPHLFVLEENGKFLHSQDTGLLESGKHHDPGKVMAFLKKWAPAAQVKSE